MELTSLRVSVAYGGGVGGMKHNRKLYAAGGMREDRLEMFRELMELSEKYKRLNQYC